MRIARWHAGHIALAGVRQAYYEAWVCNWKRVRFRLTHNGAACRAYCEMLTHEFEAINARQSWANWRTIPRNLNRRLPNRPVNAIDLCCGIGQSTEVLAYYCAPGSRLLGLEYNPRFVEVARRRRYRHDTGAPGRVTFNAQSVLETFRYPDGSEVAGGSIDVVNSCGAVGCHFDPDASIKLAGEVLRVLAPGGLALIDSGAAGTSEQRLKDIFKRAGFEALAEARSCALDRYTQVCFRKNTD